MEVRLEPSTKKKWLRRTLIQSSSSKFVPWTIRASGAVRHSHTGRRTQATLHRLESVTWREGSADPACPLCLSLTGEKKRTGRAGSSPKKRTRVVTCDFISYLLKLGQRWKQIREERRGRMSQTNRWCCCRFISIFQPKTVNLLEFSSVKLHHWWSEGERGRQLWAGYG